MSENFRVIDLGTLGGDESRARALNERGQVVGRAETGDVNSFGIPIFHAFLWLPSPEGELSAGIHDLGTLGGDNSVALDINDSLQIVGGADKGPVAGVGLSARRPFLWSDGSMSDLGMANTDFVFGQARALNNLGQVVGTESTGFACLATLWLPAPDYGLPVGLHTLPGLAGFGEAVAFDINDSGQVATRSTQACDTNSSVATLWLPAAAHGLPAGVHNLAPSFPQDQFAEARVVNSRGEVAGALGENDNFVFESFHWREGALTVLPLLPDFTFSSVGDINDLGQIVGGVAIFSSPQRRVAVLWEDGQVFDLNDRLPSDSPWVLERATGINQRGEITGTGKLNGLNRAFLMTPILFEDGFESGDTSSWSSIETVQK